MEYIAIAKNIKMSPRKVRLIADGVKKKKLTVALNSLMVMNMRAAGPIKKAIDSAVANATNNFQAKKEDLSIRDIIIGEGVSMKRFHFAGRGRTRPYKRRTSQIRVILADNKNNESQIMNKEETKQIEAHSASSGQAKTGKENLNNGTES
jgi:large subunit ribosomal protein L22